MGQAWSGTPISQLGFTQNFGAQRQQAFNKFAQNAGQYDLGQNPLYQQAAQAQSQSPFLQQFNPAQYENYFQQGVANPTIRNYEQQVLPAIKSQYQNPSGVYGSGLQGAINQSAEGLTRGLGELRANYLGQSQQQHQTGQLASIMQALGLAQAPAKQSMDYYSQLFGTNTESPLIQEAQSGWLQDVSKLLAYVAGEALKR